jgi:hypothetical protein
MVPQYRPVAVAQVSGTQPAPGMHTPDMQTRLGSQAPQSMARPQPLPTVPQYCPFVTAQVSATQLGPPTQMFWSQTSSAAQLAPQSSGRRQPSLITPQ